MIIRLVMLLILSVIVLGHGVSFEEIASGYGVQIRYADGQPIDFGDVVVMRPGDETFEYQMGKTDINGVFMFKPDTIGQWTLRVSDGLGHGGVYTVEVSDLFNSSFKDRQSKERPSVISALGYVLFIFSLWVLYHNHKNRQGQDAHS